jgi:pyruvate kinase
MNEKDRSDILFGIENDFDFIAASFVYCAQNVKDIRVILDENGGKDIQIIAKIENSEGVKNIEEIISAADGIMIARGDLGVEIDFEQLPEIQKRIIDLCLHAGKKVITATQMLESMTHNPRPTRAEISDVANAVYDGTSAIMLSGETAAGKFPVESLKVMAGTAEIAENDAHYLKLNENRHVDCDSSITRAISHATCMTASDLSAGAIIAVSWTGYTARMISCYRPMIQIIGVTINRKVWRQLALSWGVYPVMADNKESNIDEMFEHSVTKALETGLLKTGDPIVITGGSPMGMGGTTNILKCTTCP